MILFVVAASLLFSGYMKVKRLKSWSNCGVENPERVTIANRTTVWTS